MVVKIQEEKTPPVIFWRLSCKRAEVLSPDILPSADFINAGGEGRPPTVSKESATVSQETKEIKVVKFCLQRPVNRIASLMITPSYTHTHQSPSLGSSLAGNLTGLAVLR